MRQSASAPTVGCGSRCPRPGPERDAAVTEDDNRVNQSTAVGNTATSGLNMVTLGIVDGQNRTSLCRPTPLRPGRPYQITWNHLPQDYEFKAGHRLGRVPTGTNDDLTDAEPGTGAKVTIDLAGTSIPLSPVNAAPGLPRFARSSSPAGPEDETFRLDGSAQLIYSHPCKTRRTVSSRMLSELPHAHPTCHFSAHLVQHRHQPRRPLHQHDRDRPGGAARGAA
ncbi:CocE/NonD family hydrolase C-terminal non-catalytic domain-containing protein [Nonomuraea sp. NPDC059194]|uniref:CocE/NonD family hydrolase C-terminal non-catalytic domain-containing protein n=1 Tax=Nonomuraea sp. NPDC059194 TaxID=3346764 RepID=UPI0036B10D00